MCDDDAMDAALAEMEADVIAIPKQRHFQGYYELVIKQRYAYAPKLAALFGGDATDYYLAFNPLKGLNVYDFGYYWAKVNKAVNWREPIFPQVLKLHGCEGVAVLTIALAGEVD